MAEQMIKTFKEAPRGSKVVKAFSKQQAYCEGRLNQEHTVPASCWIDLGFEWDAVDVPTLLTTWPFITLTITVDGEAVENPKRYSKGPDEVVLRCADETHTGYALTNAVCMPPLPVGDYTIVWTVYFERDLDDGWNTHPKGQELVFTSQLHVVKST